MKNFFPNSKQRKKVSTDDLCSISSCFWCKVL